MELIRNGFFDSGILEPWTSCHGKLEGGVGPDNPVFLSDYNLKLLGNDCVEQCFPGVARSSERLGVWVRAYPEGMFERYSPEDYGTFQVCVQYVDGDVDRTTMTYHTLLGDDPARFLDPKYVTVAVDGEKYVYRVEVRTFGARVPWYTCGFSLEGFLNYYARAPRPRNSFPEEGRILKVERELHHFMKFVATELGPKSSEKQAAEDPIEKQEAQRDRASV